MYPSLATVILAYYNIPHSSLTKTVIQRFNFCKNWLSQFNSLSILNFLIWDLPFLVQELQLFQKVKNFSLKTILIAPKNMIYQQKNYFLSI